MVAHDIDTTEYLFGITRRLYDNMPKEEQLPLEASNRKELHFSRRTTTGQEGCIHIATAGTKTSGRGFTPLTLLLSEAAYYQNSKEVMASLLNAVPKTPESMVEIESTANGMAGDFWEMWRIAKAGDSEFEAVFASWAEDKEECALAVGNPEMFEASLSGYERGIRATHDLTLEQLNWRRNIIASNLNGDAELFKQEYPLTDTEAFLTSGRPRFDREKILHWAIQEPLRGYLRKTEAYSGSTISFEPNHDGYISLWKRPQPHREYVIGADVAEGIQINGLVGADPYDRSSADVFDRHTGEQVAQIHGEFEPDEFGRQLALLGKWYNTAYQGIERNNNGLTVINELEHQNYPDARIFSRTHTPDGSRYASPQKGYLTTSVTRVNMINRLAQAIREESLIIHSSESQTEFLLFVIKANGRAEHQDGARDDRVFSGGIAHEMIAVAPASDDALPADAGEPLRAVSFRPQKYQHENISQRSQLRWDRNATT